MPAPVPGTVPDTFVQDNGLGYQVVPTTVEQNGGTTSNWLLGGAHFVDSWSSGDAWRISVPDTSSEEETGHDKETIATDPGVDGARNSQECDDDDIVIPGHNFQQASHQKSILVMFLSQSHMRTQV